MATHGQPRLDRRLTIERQATTQAADGQQSASWGTLATVWAQKEDIAPSRRAQAEYAQQQRDIGYTTFTIRYRSDLTGAERLVCEGITYQIFGKPIEAPGYSRHQYTQIMGQRGVAT